MVIGLEDQWSGYCLCLDPIIKLKILKVSKQRHSSEILTSFVCWLPIGKIRICLYLDWMVLLVSQTSPQNQLLSGKNRWIRTNNRCKWITLRSISITFVQKPQKDILSLSIKVNLRALLELQPKVPPSLKLKPILKHIGRLVKMSWRILECLMVETQDLNSLTKNI